MPNVPPHREVAGRFFYHRSLTECLAESKCIDCQRKVGIRNQNDPLPSYTYGPGTVLFRDGASVREWQQSGLCQCCQDSVFGTG